MKNNVFVMIEEKMLLKFYNEHGSIHTLNIYYINAVRFSLFFSKKKMKENWNDNKILGICTMSH